MDAGTILSAYQIPGNISGDKTMTVPGNEPGTKADYFAAWLSLLLSFQDTLGRLSEQDREETETVEPGLLPEKDVVSEVFYPLGVIPGILPQSPSLDSVQPAPGENIPNMLVCQESPPADSAQIREELPQGSGKDMTIHRLEAELAMPEQGQGIKDKGMAHQLPPIGRDLTEPELAFGLKELLPGAGKERDTLLQKADLRSGSGEGFYETEQKAVHGDKVSELLKELSGEVKREYALTGKDNLRQGGAVSEKDRISDTETAMESSGVKGSGVYEKNENSFSSEEIIPDVRYKETITGRNFDFKQTEIPDKAQIWARVIDFIKEVPLSSAMEGRTVEKIEIKLYPAELGKLDVHLRMEDGILHLVINASDQATGNYLQNHLGELRQSLTQIGISCGSMEMSFQGEREQENEGNAPENHDYYRPTEEESISYGKAMYNMQDLMTKTRINVSI